MERNVIRDLLGLLAAEAHRHNASVKIEHARYRWRTSLTIGHRELVAVEDDDLEPALARLWAAVGAGSARFGSANGDLAAVERLHRNPRSGRRTP